MDTAADAFWLIPSLLVITGIFLASGLVTAEQAGRIPDVVLQWTYQGGETGARTLLGAIASSTITVAGTLFSITIAALSLATSQMGPRLLRAFTRDLGNQVTLGILLGTFAYALVLLRTVRGGQEEFVPQLALTTGVGLALACIGALIYFLHHVAMRINVDTVIDLVHHDLERSVDKLTDETTCAPVEEPTWEDGGWVRATSAGYLQQVDENRLADWASEHDVVIKLLVRPGHYLHSGAIVARVSPAAAKAAEPVCKAMIVGRRPSSLADIEFNVEQLVEVAARALSPGINDPYTANQILDRFGAVLCQLSKRQFRRAAIEREGRVAVIRNPNTYEGLADAMFNIIRQNAADQPSVLIRLIDVLYQVALCERDPARLSVLSRHVELAAQDGRRGFSNAADRAELMRRRRRFSEAMREGEPQI